MEDILSSIRKYVAESESSSTSSSSNGENSNADEYDVNTGSPDYEHENANLRSGNDRGVINLGVEDVAEKTDDVILPPNQDVQNDVYTNKGSHDLYSEDDMTVLDNSHEYKLNDELKGNGSPFNKLAEALKAYGKQKRNPQLNLNMTVEQFFRTVTENYLQKWMDANLKRAVDEIVRKEIEKLKQE